MSATCCEARVCLLTELSNRWNNGKGRKVFKHVVDRGLKVHRSVLTRMEACDHSGRPGAYVPLIRPNIHVAEGGEDKRHCERMSHEEWVKGSVGGMALKESWFKWVE